MTTARINKFASFDLTHEEELSGTTFTAYNVLYMQNIRSSVAHSILNLAYDSTNHVESLQQHAYLKGQLAILDMLLDSKPTN